MNLRHNGLYARIEDQGYWSVQRGTHLIASPFQTRGDANEWIIANECLFAEKSDVTRDPFTDQTKSGIFRNHHCSVCQDGERPCREGKPNLCGNPRTRND